MSSMIVAFPKKEIATNIRNILVRNGNKVLGICTTGAQVLHYADTLDDGIIVCGYRLPDMLYTDIRSCLPETFEVLLIASPGKWSDGIQDGVVWLSMPIKVYDLVSTVEMLSQVIHKKRKKRREAAKNRNPEQKAIIERAKLILMDRNGLTEDAAHRYLQKNSMDSGTSMLEMAQMVLISAGVKGGRK